MTNKAQDLTILPAAHPLDDLGDVHFDSFYDVAAFVTLFPFSGRSVPPDGLVDHPWPES